VPFDDLADALAWLDGHVNFEATMPSRRSLPTLDRMREVMSLLGDPHRAAPVVHLTGTNGKGSTAAMVTSLLAARGLSVGTYTSPNLHRVNERIARHGVPIDDDALLDVLETLARLEPLLSEPLTRFELLTAAAFLHFADEAVDVAVVEVGVGGRWDSTNVADGDVAVITNVSYDHTDVLGPTLEDIASDKSGIVKARSRVVVGETAPALVSLVRDAARSAGAAQLWARGDDFATTANRVAVGGRLVDVRTPGGAYGEVLVPLHGSHQGDNASCALTAVEAFFGAPLDADVVDEAFAAVRVPGRLEVVGRHPLVVLDGAHNVAGMTVLARALVEDVPVLGETVAVVGMLGGRDPVAMLDLLLTAGVRAVVVCTPPSPRALAAPVVAEAATGLGMDVTVVDAPADALREALGRVAADGRVVACGSLYVVAEVRRAVAADAV
jgi:dihydrofolate synthase/folylpolyglutamate synthase